MRRGELFLRSVKNIDFDGYIGDISVDIFT